MKSIALIGFMGSGKSTVGKLLAEALGLDFVDLDNVAERIAGAGVEEVFARDGESGWRRHETSALEKLAGKSSIVLACGGGVVLSSDNRELLKRHFMTVYLETKQETLLERLDKTAGRPLLETEDREAALRRLYQDRLEIYRTAADVTVATDGKRPEQVSAEVVAIANRSKLEDGVFGRVQVRLGERSYPIHVGSGLLDECGRLVSTVLPAPKRLIIITNTLVSRFYGQRVAAGFESAGYRVSVITVPAGERYKSLATADKLYGRLLESGADRTAAIVALGGGVIGDLAGFVAATYMRGVDYIQIPTTLLAQVDSSVGGKTAVNHRLAKNIIGAFHQPKVVIIDPLVLGTLPKRELRAGLAEVVKYALIAGGPLLDLVDKTLPLKQDLSALNEIITACCRYKAEVVIEDERDQGRRAVLNYGHTIGHAIEAVARYRQYNHGEALAVGMVGAAKIAVAKGFLGRSELELHGRLMRSAGLSLELKNIDAASVYDHLRHDKKRVGDEDRFVLLNGIGRPEVAAVESDLVKRVIGELGSPVRGQPF